MSDQESIIQFLADALMALMAIFAEDIAGWFYSFF